MRTAALQQWSHHNRTSILRWNRGVVLVAAGLIALGLILGALGLARPIGQDETFNLMAARLLVSSRPIVDDGSGGTALLYQPPLYPWLLSRAQAWLGPQIWAMRVVGWLGFALTGLLLFVLVRRLGPGTRDGDVAALLALALYVMSPMGLQGIAVTDIDPAVLPAWTVLWILLLLWYAEGQCAPRLTALAAATAGGFALKLSTPSVVVAVSLLVLAMTPRHRHVAVKAAGAAAAGAAFFAGSYTLWGAGRGLAVANLLAYLGGRVVLVATEAPSILIALPKTSAELALWMSPFMLLLAMGAVSWGLGRADWRLRLIATLGGVLLAGYLVVGGTTFGYPKYHAPALPILCALVGLWAAPGLRGADRDVLKTGFILGILVLMWNLLVVGDLLFVLRYKYRWAAAMGDPTASNILRHAAWRGVGLLLPALPVTAVLARRLGGWGPRLRVALLVTIMGSLPATDIIQAAASFGPSHYGEVGAEATAKFLRARLDPAARVIATREILFLLGKLENPSRWPLSSATWNDPERFGRELTDPRLGAVVYGIAANTIQQYRRVFRDPDVLEILRARFQQERIGGYTVWWRSGP
jgi:4-amino-4-deoxy-L-arabinose transferase-like glycosyltransferase